MDSVATLGYNNSSSKDSITPPVSSLSPLKLVFLGDSSVGKTSLLSSCKEGVYHENGLCHTSVLESFTKSVMVNGSEYICLLWDTIGSNDFEKLRPLSYPKTDCFVICYAVNNQSSLKNTKLKWIPEIELHAPDIPFILVGTKSDLREAPNQAPDLITPEQVQSVHEGTDLAGFDCVECSAKDLASIDTVISVSVLKILHHGKTKAAAAAAANSQSLCVIT